ncbi:MAG: hypothetical protein ACNA77_11005 [Opitutales bacterium]
MNRFRKQNKKEGVAPPSSTAPLREFKDDGQATPPSMFLFRLEVAAYWLVPLIIFCAIIAGGIYVAYKYDWFSGDYADTSVRPDYLDDSGEILIPKLLQSHLSAIGGRTALESIQSLRFKGLLKETSGDVAFQILVSLPDKGMVMTDLGQGARHKLVLNGHHAWQVFEFRDGSQKIVPLDEANTKSLIWSLRVHNTFRRLALGGNANGFSARKIEFQGKPCYELTKLMPDGSEFLAVLGAENLYLLKSVEMTPGPNGPELLEVHYHDHRLSSGIVEAHETQTYKGGQLYNQVFLESVEINAGLISALFEVPEELTK